MLKNQTREKIQKLAAARAAGNDTFHSTVPALGLTEKEVRSYSFFEAILAQIEPDRGGFERACSDAIADLVDRKPQGIFIPAEITAARDLNVTTGTAGGNLVQDDLAAGSFIGLLRNKMMTIKMGATELPNLRGNTLIPAQSGAGTAYWVAESGAPTESQMTFAQKSLSPKTVGAFSDISRRLIKQGTPEIGNLVMSDAAQILALAIDLAALHGTGASNQPTGIAATSGIGSVAGGTNGLAPTYGNLVDLFSSIAQDNAGGGTLGYLTNSAVIGKLMQTAKVSSTDSVMVCNAGPNPEGFTQLLGMRCGVSNQVSSTLTKGTSSGVCSAIFFGNWADLLIGMWGPLDVLVDPYSGGTTGTVRIVTFQDVDIAVRHAESFSAMLDALAA